jgi:hypothetical protein
MISFNLYHANIASNEDYWMQYNEIIVTEQLFLHIAQQFLDILRRFGYTLSQTAQ